MMGDWLEKELEDYIVAHPRELCEQAIMYFKENVTVLGRQVRCQFGIIDVLLWVQSDVKSYVLVVECKAKHEKGLVVEQVSRYLKAVEYANIYSDLSGDAWPDFGTDEIGWAHLIELEAYPLIVAPSFDRKFIDTYQGMLATAEKVGDRFVFGRVNGDYPDCQGQLNDILEPVIKRAQNDAKARKITEGFRRGFPATYRYSAN